MAKKRLIQKPLSTQELDNALRQNKWTARLYRGTFPVDLLPRFRPTQESLVVVNLGNSYTAGTHWILLFYPLKTSINHGICYIFDSFGRNAECSKDLSSFLLKTNTIKYKFNRKQLQDNNSASCGYFVLTVALLLARGVTPEHLHNYFSSDKSLNDARVASAVKTEFQLT